MKILKWRTDCKSARGGIFLFLFVLMFYSSSCKCSLEIKLNPRDSSIQSCFSPVQLMELEKQIKRQKRIKCNFFLVEKEIISSIHGECVGLFYLYSNDCKGKWRHYIPVLKFTDRIYTNFNDSDHLVYNEDLRIEKIMNDFLLEYGDFYSMEELVTISHIFKHGIQYAYKRHIHFL